MLQNWESQSVFHLVNIGKYASCSRVTTSLLTICRDGKDGPWSTFRIEVGTPPQQVRVLPASDQSSTWLIVPEGCTGDAGPDCAENRGRTYKRNESSTWKEYGSYELNTFLEERVGLDGNGLYGYDTLSLGWTGDGLPSLEGQLVAAMSTDSSFYLGSLALNPRPNNFTDFNNPIPSLMQHLKNISTPIPSTSWSYTAGSHNLAPKVLGSLVLGGYDTTRFMSNDVTFPFGADISLDFQVAIQSVTTNITDKPLLSTGIISYIDTLVAEIWLPTRACELFEETFGLIWDNTTELYLMNDSLHESLLEKNPTVSFKIGPQVSGDSVTIDMPYFNWYQTATQAYIGNTSSLYFPLKRAANDTQYVLGRTFLQSAYLSADYDRNTFNVSQALYPSSSTSANVVPILPPRNGTSTPGGGNNGNNSNTSKSGSGLGTGAIAGIAVGGVAVVAIAAAVIFFLRRRKKTKEEEAHELEDTNQQNSGRHEAPGDSHVKYEVGEGIRHEVIGDSHQKAELSTAGEQSKPELDGTTKPTEVDGTTRAIYEMPADEIKKYVEVEGEGHLNKGSPVISTAVSSRRGTNTSEAGAYLEDDRAPLTPSVERSWRSG